MNENVNMVNNININEKPDRIREFKENRIRFYFFDNIRVFLTLLVIIGHAAITYGGVGSWFYQEAADSTTTIIFSLLASIGQSFAMGLFFFIAGYFEPQSIDSKGPLNFAKDRLIRLGIPLLFFTFFLYLIITWMIDVVVNGQSISFIEDFMYNFRTGNFDTGPLWFVLYLLMFSLIYAISYKLFKFSKKRIVNIKITNNNLVLLTVGLGFLTFIIRIWFPQTSGIESIGWLNIQIGTSPQYIIFFILGILCYRFQWLDQFTLKLGKFWGKISIICSLFIPFLTVISGAIDLGPSILLGGINWYSFLYAMNEMFLGTSICIVIISWSQIKLNYHGKLARILAKNAYSVYIFHAVFVVGLALLYRNIIWIPFLKWLLLSTSAIILSFTFSLFIGKLRVRVALILKRIKQIPQ
jgi:glucan biosynthesis protein C